MGKVKQVEITTTVENDMIVIRFFPTGQAEFWQPDGCINCKPPAPVASTGNGAEVPA